MSRLLVALSVSAVLAAATIAASHSPAHAADSDDPAAQAAPDDVARSEYRRLSEELDRLAKRNQWPGVERTFQSMLQTGVTPEFDDFKTGAHAAQALGDIGEARDRLVRASTIREDKEVLDWLWAIDSSYGPVYIAGNPGQVSLAPKTMPFDPIKAKAVQIAMAAVEETGIFQGLLPKGEYDFGGKRDQLVIDVGSSMRRVDLRTEVGVRKTERKQKKTDK